VPDPIDRATVARVAQLARLQLSAEELDQMQRELAFILTAFQRLNELEDESLESPAEPGDGSAPLADDDIAPPIPVETLMRMAPASHESLITVPRVFLVEE